MELKFCRSKSSNKLRLYAVKGTLVRGFDLGYFQGSTPNEGQLFSRLKQFIFLFSIFLKIFEKVKSALDNLALRKTRSFFLYLMNQFFKTLCISK
jgi:hypothetical protein